MSRQDLEKKIKNKETIQDLEDSISMKDIPVSRNQGNYFAFPFVSNNETFVFTIVNVSHTNNNYQIRFTIYKWDEQNKRLIQTTQFTNTPLTTNSAPITLRESGIYYLDIETNSPIKQLDFVITAKGFKNRKILEATTYIGREFDGGLRTFPRIQEKECNLPLRYEMLEGELPMGLTVNEAGRIRGTICSIDDMLQAPKDSPAFNWFFENHDGVNQPIGLVFRFKMKVWILGTDHTDPDFYDERWFCIRLYNNWSFDKINFLRNVKKSIIEHPCELNFKTEESLDEKAFCPPCNFIPEETNTFTEIEFDAFCKPCNIIPEPVYKPIPLKRSLPRLSECIACQDPTKDRIIETIHLQERNYFSPEEVFRFYTQNMNNPNINSLDMAKLSNSELFQELLEYMLADDVANRTSLIEMSINNQGFLKLTKFQDLTPLDNASTQLRNIGNQKKTYLETQTIVYRGAAMIAEEYQQ